MDPENLFAALHDGGVITGDGETITVRGEFREASAAHRETLAPLDGAELEAELAECVGEEASSFLLEYAADVPDFLARYCALAEFAEELSHDEIVRTVIVLSQFHDDVEDGGSPSTFLPVRGDHLPPVLAVSGPAVVYVWREECPPCDTQQETLDEVFNEPPDDIALFSVYGPDWSELLFEEYSVIGGPITLFMIGNTVDSRLHGAQYPEAVESEIQILREVTAP